jgi:hypothetical protein
MKQNIKSKRIASIETNEINPAGDMLWNIQIQITSLSKKIGELRPLGMKL